jgi:hypothetical protein
MDYEMIRILANKNSISNIVSTIKTIQFERPDLKIGTPSYGELSDKTILSFKVPKEQYSQIITVFSRKGVPVSTKDGAPKESLQSKYGNVTASKLFGNTAKPPENKTKKAALKPSDLDEIAEKGNYQEIMRIIKDINVANEEVIEHAKNLLPDAVNRAISRAFHHGISFQSKVEESLEILTNIASDANLIQLRKTELMKQAGEKAIELCSKYPKFVDMLIPLCNNNVIPKIINLKAAVKFGEITLNNSEKFADDLDIAVRNLNTKWLFIAFDVSGHELQYEESKTFNELQDYIKRNR